MEQSIAQGRSISMLIDHRPLAFWVDKLRAGEYFSLTKHSDASLYCMEGIAGSDCNGCNYTWKLKKGLIKSLVYKAANYYHGVQRLTDRDNARMDVLLYRLGIKEHKWYDVGIFASQLVDGGLYPLLAALGAHKLTIISNNRVKAVSSFVSYDYFIETPESNTYEDKSRIVDEVLSKGSGVFAFSCGMAATPIIAELHSKVKDSWLIDTGHIWDALLGNKIRHYLKDLTQAHVNRNLHP